VRRLALLFLLCAVPALAQDKEGLGGGPDDRPVTDGMLQQCPDLAGAKGKKKAQLLALYFDLDWKKAGDAATQRDVRALFDLGSADDRALLEKSLAEKAPHRSQGGLRAVIAAEGSSGLFFALGVFEKGPAEVRGRVLDSLFAVRLVEGWSFLVHCLDDKAAVPDHKAAAEAPLGYADLRVCDHAHRTLVARLETQEKAALPAEVGNGRGGSLTKIEARDAQIAALKKWLEGDTGKAVLGRTRESALDGPDSDAKKQGRELLERLGVK